ncbi:glycosyltransferase [Paenibacillus sp. OV219]|uniref:glycosyltransferase n=1 Tax=Paenibacillus sp. OV219 TaxID=1884377 RepID=UPI0008CF1BC8|nr:glycosyltransferase [Paenibacillus sp. OV219]SEN75901.1 Glycosyl transferase family 2 [Paenibacillus sp. OV219]
MRSGKSKRAISSGRGRRPGKSSGGSHHAAYTAGYGEGIALKQNEGGGLSNHEAKLRMNERWTRRCMAKELTAATSGKRMQEGRAFASGFAAALGLPNANGGWQPAPLTRSAAAVVRAGADAIPASIKQLLRLPLTEIIVVQEGASETQFAELRALPEIKILNPGEAIGADVWRAVGARMTRADIVLFADAAQLIEAEKLAQLLAAAQAGADVALVSYASRLGPFREWDDLMRVRAFVNWSLGRQELGVSSVGLLPHAWSRAAIESVGVKTLAVPPLAHVIALQQRLRVQACSIMKRTNGKSSPAWSPLSLSHTQESKQVVFGDHIEALRAAMKLKGARLTMPDHSRCRSAAGGAQ